MHAWRLGVGWGLYIARADCGLGETEMEWGLHGHDGASLFSKCHVIPFTIFNIPKNVPWDETEINQSE